MAKKSASKPVSQPAVAAPAAVAATSVAPVSHVIAADEQHLLLLFIPIKKGTFKKAIAAAQQAFGPRLGKAAADSPDPRPLTGVHFFMIYPVPADANVSLPMPIKGASVPTFQTSPGKDLLAVMSIYDANFAPYITAFFNIQPVVDGLNALMFLMDETGLVDPKDASSAVSIRTHGGVVKNSDEFLALLRRYNFADGAIPAALQTPNTPKNPKYFLGATFPGLTVGKLLSHYPDLPALYPASNAPTITYDPAIG